MTRHRLFVALALPRPVRSALIAAMGTVAGARWQDDAQLHCTVRFLGELDRHVGEDAAVSLAGIRHPAIPARIEGVGVFDHGGRIDTLWAGVAPLDALRAFHAKVDRALIRAGLMADGRAYRPHVTLARFGRGAAPPPGIVASIALPPLGFTFAEMRLYESHFGREGALYEVVERYPLG
ncbi:RNA 2',3'-cyclic phosphodiesterase [Sphingomonas sp.]|uniref:RNA 2',3'-cyclic phosphodiesterase n=1 Tax=Sphingomonas sp. TaxID=28214 RepID=UPI003AFFF9BD